jgi:hypothetical protein
MVDVIAPLALYGYGDTRSLLRLPYRVLMMLVSSTKHDSVKSLIERKLNVGSTGT